MSAILRLYVADGQTIDLSASDGVPAPRFLFDQPAAREITITEVRLLSETLPHTIRFILDGLTIGDAEEAYWVVTVAEDDMGVPRHDLEYCMMRRHGKRLRHPIQLKWDHDKEEMIVR